MTALAAQAPPVDLNAARTCVVQLDLATRLVRRSADDVTTTQAPGWWGPASTGYATARTDAGRSLHDAAAAAGDLAAGIDRYVIDATVALRRWEDAQDDLRRARDAAPVVLAGGVLDPRPAAHAEADAAARVRAAETELHGAATALVTAASAAIDRLVPPPPVDPVRSSIERWSWLSGLEVDDSLPPPQGAPAVDPNLMQRAMARGMVEAGVDMMRTVPDLLVMLANHSLGPTSSYRFPAVRFTFEDDLSRAMDEVTGPCTWDTNPLCSTYKWGGYGTATIGTAFIPGAGAESAATSSVGATLRGTSRAASGTTAASRTTARATGLTSESAERFTLYRPVGLVSHSRRLHILHGDDLDGSHRWPGAPAKTPFPRDWGDDEIIRAVEEVATDPNSHWIQQTGSAGADVTRNGDPARFVVIGVYDGEIIKVIVAPAGEGIITAFPF